MITCGDVLDVLQQTPDEHYSAALCDPPYGISFMGRRWDHGVPSSEVWKEVWRVLKPGAVLMAFGGTRTWHRLAVNIEDAGFEMFDTIMWLYGSGFPKSTDISKAIDKEAGAVREVVGTYNASSSGGITRFEMNSNGQTQNGRTPELAQKRAAKTTDLPITAPATDAARTWAGYGSALKPAHEPILLFRKPRRGTYAQTAMEYGTGCINVDGCRVGTEKMGGYEVGAGGMLQPSTQRRMGYRPKWDREDRGFVANEATGRWPANIILDEIFVRVRVLMYNTPDGIKQAIQEYYHDYELQGLRHRDQSSAKPIQEKQGAILQSGVLRQRAIQKDDGRESPDVWADSHGRSQGKNRESQYRQESGEIGSMEGRAILDEGVRNGSVGLTTGERTADVWGDGEDEQRQIHPGTPVGNGSTSGEVAREARSRASYQRGKRRQPARESGNARQPDAQADALENYEGVEETSQRERGFAQSTLRVAENHIPTQWLKYFEPIDEYVRQGSAARLDEMSGELTSGGKRGGARYENNNSSQTSNQGVYGQFNDSAHYCYGDQGGPSRFFQHCSIGDADRFVYAAKASRAERGDGNNHPCCKPLKLTEYLARLIVPPVAYRDDARLLVPFCGSGSEILGALLAGWLHVDGIDNDAGYVEIAHARIAAEAKAIFGPLFAGVA